MTDVSIIGAGRLGTSLGYALLKKGYKIKALSCRTIFSAEESRKIIGEGIASIDNIQTAGVGEIVNNGYLVIIIEQFKAGMAANISSPTCD